VYSLAFSGILTIHHILTIYSPYTLLLTSFSEMEALVEAFTDTRGGAGGLSGGGNASKVNYEDFCRMVVLVSAEGMRLEVYIEGCIEGMRLEVCIEVCIEGCI
jgi:hypothetical protein